MVFIGINDLYHSKKSINDCWSILKSPITERTFECKGKYQGSHSAENVNNIIVSTNNDFVETEAFDRRWQVVRVPSTKQNKDFFKEVYVMLRNYVAMSHLYTWYIQTSLDEYEPQIIPSVNSNESGYQRFVRYYLDNVASSTMTEEHLGKYWSNYEDYAKEIINLRIGTLGEPLSSIYAQFREWALNEGISPDIIPDQSNFKKGMFRFIDVAKPNKFISKNKRSKVDVIHLK